MAAWSLKVLLLVSLTLPEPSRSLSEADKEDLVGAHNKYRSLVPDASNILKMNWDKDLAKMAAAFAQECVWEHNNERGNTGENLYMITSPIDLKQAVEKWYLEFTDYTYETMDCTPKMMCGHYTQLIWANTDKVGCGTHLCEEVKGLIYKNLSLLVCNYLPPGNVLGQHPYKKGTPCSECPDGTKCIDSLCTSELEPEEEPKLEPTAEPETKQEPIAEPETKLEPIEPETKLEPMTEPETKLEPTTEPETEQEAYIELKTKPEPKMEPETTSKPTPKLDPQMKSKLTQGTDHKLESEIESDEAAKANGSLGLPSSTVLTFIMLLVLYSASS
ncbi:peptidase inhibitor 16-like [Mustelus asterias]